MMLWHEHGTQPTVGGFLFDRLSGIEIDWTRLAIRSAWGFATVLGFAPTLLFFAVLLFGGRN